MVDTSTFNLSSPPGNEHSLTRRTLLMTLSASSLSLAGCGGGSGATTEEPNSNLGFNNGLPYVYVANTISGAANATISMFTINNSGVLIPLTPASVRAPSNGIYSMAINPAGTNLYMTCVATNCVAMFSIGEGGVLFPLSTRTVATDIYPNNIKIHPSGKFAYVTNSSSGTISLYLISQGEGVLSPLLACPSLAVGKGVNAMAINTVGNFAYTVNCTPDANGIFTITTFSIGGDGTLRTCQIINAATMSDPIVRMPFSIVLHPNKNLAYVLNRAIRTMEPNTIAAYNIGSDGTLSPVNTSPISFIETATFDMQIDDTGSYIYVMNRGTSTISMFSIGTDGSLSALNPASVPATGTQPTAMVFYAGRSLAYVPNRTTSTISTYAIGNDGQLTGLANPIKTLGTPCAIAIRNAPAGPLIIS